MVPATLTLGILGLLFGLGLYVASRVFHVEEDPRIEEIAEALPGASCSALAVALVHGSAPVGSCPIASAEQLKRVASILGTDFSTMVTRKVAVVHCQGRKVPDKFLYDGPKTCAASVLLLGGHKECPDGCLGLGDCVRACPFDAIHMVEGIPVVDEEKCTGCGKCVAACPRNIIDLQPVDKHVHVLCRSHEKGAKVRKYCEVGCTACKKCERTCPYDAIHVRDFLAVIDYEKCTSCGKCAAECPMKTILDFRSLRKAAAKKESA